MPRPPQQEGEPEVPGDGPSNDCKKQLRALYEVIRKYEVVRKPLYEALRREGADPEAVMRCLAQVAMVRPSPGGGGLVLNVGDLVVDRPPINWSDLFDVLDPRPGPGGTFRPISREAEALAKLLRTID